jgi:general stress protein YciG
MSKEDLTPFTTDDDRAKEAGRKGGLNKKGSKQSQPLFNKL